MNGYDTLVRNAQTLLEGSRNSSWELARICHEVLSAGIPAKKFSADVGGISAQHSTMCARTWERYASRRHEARSFSEFYLLASTTKERAAQMEAIAEREGLAVTTVRNYGLAPPAKGTRPDLLKTLIFVRRKLLASIDNARVASVYVSDLDVLTDVAAEIAEAANELVKTLRPMRAVQ